MKKIIFAIICFHISLLSADAQWHFQNSGTTSVLRDIEFINENTGWICGSDGTILKTTNGGINWIQQSNEATGKSLYGIFPVNANVVYCVGYFETILKTTNGGDNWLTIQNGPIGEGNSHFCVFFLNGNTGWVGSTYQIIKTTNGGINWISYLYSNWLNDIYFKDSLNGIAVNGEAYRYGITFDGGLNWSQQISGEGNYFDISILPYNKNIGFIVNSMGFSVRKTTNFGITFDSIGNIPYVISPYSLYCSKFTNENIGWAGGSYGVLYKTADGGKTWHSQNSLNQAFVRRMYALNDTVAWAVGGGGKIIHTTNGGDSVTAIRQISSNVPDRFELYQNYPNPFNPITIIRFQIKDLRFVTLKIFDALGRGIETLIGEKKTPGTYEIKFNGGNLPSGIYFYKLESENLNIVKKMILIK
jgi:photosystem II stability/assembly factor-like uncharacterized protein